ncbi:MAG: hypothetical protein LBV00_00830, partial [Propionibacteriaceae bacterium]|nr:hypothetical protein [Propionibacteriaceae bacterium]
MSLVYIDIDALQDLVTGIDTACGRLEQLKVTIRSHLSDARWKANTTTVDDVSFARIDEAIFWLQNQRKPLQERLDLARAVASGTLRFGQTLPEGATAMIDEDIIAAIHDIADAAKKGTLTDQEWQDLVGMANRSEGIAQWVGAQLFGNLNPQQAAALVSGVNQWYDDKTSSAAYHDYQQRGGDLSYADWVARYEGASQERIDAIETLLEGAKRYSPSTLMPGYLKTVMTVIAWEGVDDSWGFDPELGLPDNMNMVGVDPDILTTDPMNPSVNGQGSIGDCWLVEVPRVKLPAKLVRCLALFLPVKGFSRFGVGCRWWCRVW